MTNRLPDFLVIGGQRCGTTSLFDWLAGHPSLWMNPSKEIHYFDLNMERGDAWYRARFDAAPADRRLGEATPYYLFHPFAPRRIAKVLPCAKFIALLRDPVDRAISSYFHAVRHGREALPIADALDAERERLADDLANMKGDEFTKGVHHQWNSYVARGRYADLLAHFWRHLPRQQTLVIFFEDLIAEPNRELDRLCAFLDVPPSTAPFPHIQAGKRESDEVDARIRARLRDVFAEDDRQLAQLLGRRLPWSQASPPIMRP